MGILIHPLNENNMPKFDVCVMNPPYNDDRTAHASTTARRHAGSLLHVHFIEKMLDVAGQVLVICPVQKWLVGGGGVLRDHIHKNGILTSVDFYDAQSASQIFGVNTGMVGILHLNNHHAADTAVYTRGVLQYTQPSTSVIITTTNQPTVTLLSKLIAHGSIVDSRGVDVGSGPVRGTIRQFVSTTGTVPVVETIGKAGEPLILCHCTSQILDPNSPAYVTPHHRYRVERNTHTWRLGINQGGTAHKLSSIKIIPPGTVTSYAIMTISCTSEHEAMNMLKYFASPLVQFVVRATHSSRNNSKQTFKHIPNIDLTRSWTDAELYEHFNLTQEEIDLVESTIK